MRRFLVSLMVVGMMMLGMSAGFANNHPPRTVTICHATASVDQPYVQLTVNQASADGIVANRAGDSDHYGNPEHAGPVFDPAIHTASGMEWGDIIPPIPNVHGGRNWNEAGRAIYNNGCQIDS